MTNIPSIFSLFFVFSYRVSDVIAVKGRTLEAYEVKCSYRRVKAKKQLHRIKRLMPRVKKVFLFCGESGKIEDMK